MSQGEQARVILESGPIAQFALDQDHRLVFANRSFYALVGAPIGSWNGVELWHSWSSPDFGELRRALSEGPGLQTQIVEFEFTDIRASVEFHIEQVDGLWIVGIVDVTKYKRRQDDILQQMLASQKLFEQLSTANNQATASSFTDVLTGLFNRRRAEQVMETVFGALSSRSKPLSFITLDIDHFKGFNDTYGHMEGDNVLRKVGAVLASFAQESETPARIGGEEFMVICPGADLESAVSRAQALLDEIRKIEGVAAKVTASLGVACVSQSDLNWGELLDRADRAMYAAKSGGRNRVVPWTDDLGTSTEAIVAA